MIVQYAHAYLVPVVHPGVGAGHQQGPDTASSLFFFRQHPAQRGQAGASKTRARQGEQSYTEYRLHVVSGRYTAELLRLAEKEEKQEGWKAGLFRADEHARADILADFSACA